MFAPHPAHGHVNPMLPVMAELVARGELVRAVVGSEFVDAVSGAGALPIRLPTDFEVYVPERSPVSDIARRAAAKVRRVAARRAAFDLVTSELRSARPDLVVTDPMAPWADRAARCLSVPTALFSTTYAINERVVREVLGFPVPGARWLHPIVRRYRRGRRLVLVNTRPELQPEPHTFPDHVRFVGPLIRSDDLVDVDLPWNRFRSGRTLLVSPGTVFAREPEFFRTVVREFADTDWTVVLAIGRTARAELGPLPGNVIAHRSVPQLALLRHTAVFVTHGGMNSVLEALAAGVPMMLAPRSREQKATTRRLVDLGAGVPMNFGDLRRQVERLADDKAVRMVVDRIRADIAGSDTVAVAADLLCEQVVNLGRTGCPDVPTSI